MEFVKTQNPKNLTVTKKTEGTVNTTGIVGLAATSK
jgi:hypothetical protein